VIKVTCPSTGIQQIAGKYFYENKSWFSRQDRPFYTGCGNRHTVFHKLDQWDACDCIGGNCRHPAAYFIPGILPFVSHLKNQNIQKTIMIHQIETQWMGKMQFNALVNGHTIIMDAPERVGGEDNGPIPKPFVLTALSGCTGMDVVALLRKAGKEISDFSITVSGEITKQHPIEYVAIHLDYLFSGDDVFKNDALEAVITSQEKLCGVSNMLKKIMPLTWDIYYNGEKIFTNKKQELAVA
jgi:putative redox protein